MKHFNIRIHGDVQGVGFRWSVKKKADELGIFGFVRNESDGTVYVEVEGQENDLSAFISWCRKERGYARINKVETDEAAIKNYPIFDIRI